jgi:hypothetical protein
MQHTEFRRRASIVALGALTVASVSYAVAASGASPSAPETTCRASLARVTIGGEVIEPVVANANGKPCVAEEAGVGQLPTDPLLLKVLYAETATTEPQAKAGVAEVTIPLSTLHASLPDISAQVLTARASASCTNGELTRSGSSRVVGLQIGAQGGSLPPEDEYTDIDVSPLLRVQLNEQTTANGVLTQRALHVTALPGTDGEIDVVVSEAQAGGGPSACQTTSPSSTGPTPTGTATSTPTAGPAVGWMNGGGQVGPKEVQHAFVLPCTLAQDRPGPNLTVEVPGANRFKLTRLTEVACSYDRMQGAPEQPTAGFNTIKGKGLGTCGKAKDVDVSFTFTDEGEPAAGRDSSAITIGDGSGPDPCDLVTSGTINGNHQAHRGNNPPA